MADKQCAACGEANQADNNFCTKCGSGEFKQEQSATEAWHCPTMNATAYTKRRRPKS